MCFLTFDNVSTTTMMMMMIGIRELLVLLVMIQRIIIRHHHHGRLMFYQVSFCCFLNSSFAVTYPPRHVVSITFFLFLFEWNIN